MPVRQTNGIETYYETYGDGPPVVFVHGALSDHRLWAEQARPLADDYRVVVYDVRGHGRTGGSDLESYSMDRFADDLDALVRALDLDRPAICGLSMGGMIAQVYAAGRAEDVAAFCTVGTWTPETLSVREWVENRVLRAVDALSVVVPQERLDAAIEWTYQLFVDEGASGDLEKAERIQESHAAEFPEPSETEVTKIRDALSAFSSMTIDHTTISVPSLCLYGERELASAARHAEYMADRIPDADARQIPDAGHNSHVDNPQFVVGSLREFLDEALSGHRSA